METREARFEKMLSDVQTVYAETCAKMERLKTEGKTKTATYRELLGNKMVYQTMLTLYRSYGLTE